MSINKVILIGNLGKDPELRRTQGDNAVAQLSIATTRTWLDKNNNKKEETEWHRVVVWGRQAESVNKYLSKGRQVYIEGRLQTRSYEDKEGVKRYATEVVAERVQFLGQKSDNQGGDRGRDRDDRSDRSGRGRERDAGADDDTYVPPGSFDNDDIPF